MTWTTWRITVPHWHGRSVLGDPETLMEVSGRWEVHGRACSRTVTSEEAAAWLAERGDPSPCRGCARQSRRARGESDMTTTQQLFEIAWHAADLNGAESLTARELRAIDARIEDAREHMRTARNCDRLGDRAEAARQREIAWAIIREIAPDAATPRE